MFIFSEISLNPIPEARIFSTCTFCRLFMQIPPQGGVAKKGSKSNNLINLPKIKNGLCQKEELLFMRLFLLSLHSNTQVLVNKNARTQMTEE